MQRIYVGTNRGIVKAICSILINISVLAITTGTVSLFISLIDHDLLNLAARCMLIALLGILLHTLVILILHGIFLYVKKSASALPIIGENAQIAIIDGEVSFPRKLYLFDYNGNNSVYAKFKSKEDKLLYILAN